MELPPEETEDALRARWRRVGQLFSLIVLSMIEDVVRRLPTGDESAEPQRDRNAKDARVIANFMISVQRAMEAEDRYKSKDGAGDGDDVHARRARELRELEAFERRSREAFLRRHGGGDPQGHEGVLR